MTYSICLDQFSTNFNVNSLSSNGFSIYTNLDYNTPIASGIPYQDLFAPPIGDCPLVIDVPQGATQILVIDNCSSFPSNVAPIFGTSETANSLVTSCCYSLINIPTQPTPFCTTCDLDFDVFSSSFVGQIIAGNLTSTCGPITDYTIGWYRNGDYSAPEFVSGYGNAFVPYQLTHPLAGNTAPYVTAGNWEGIIHDIAINGVTYSSVSGLAGGTSIPFESCFGTVVVAPLQCDNGTFPLPYTHQKSFTAVGNGATPPVISTTYQLDSSTEYFAYDFRGYNVWDELEIKFISGDPNNTGNPSLYSQPIYLEKARIGSTNNTSNINTLGNINNNTYPKKIQTDQAFKRVLTLTNISRSANPSLPDSLDIKITPNPTNNQTNWILKMQCLDTFNCDDCLDPFPAAKISKINFDKLCCGTQHISLNMSGSCDGSPTLWSNKLIQSIPNVPDIYSEGYTSGYSNIAGNYPPYYITTTSPITAVQGSTPSNCNILNSGYETWVCASAIPNSSTSYHKSTTIVNGQLQGIISMSFNNQTDYLYYKNAIIGREASLINVIGPITYDPTNINYYTWYQLFIPMTDTPCGDGTPAVNYYIHRTAYPNITYVEDPTNNYWSITIPQPVIQNQFPQSSCSNCWNMINVWLNNNYNPSAINAPILNVTNNFGSKSSNVFSAKYSIQYPPFITPSGVNDVTYTRQMPIYSFKTLPFVSSSTGWVNLPSLEAVPCPALVSSSMPYILSVGSGGGYGASYYGIELQFIIHFPNITGSSDWFRLYTNVSSSNGIQMSTSPYSNPPQQLGNLIYEYTASIGTVYSSSYFIGGSPTLTINDLC